MRALATLPALPITLAVLYFRYDTIRYEFSPEGIRMSWGVLFRHEIVLNYARIQDIHLRSNAIERWLGLAAILQEIAAEMRALRLALTPEGPPLHPHG